VANEKLPERIAMNPRIMVGKPVIRGTGITAERAIEIGSEAMEIVMIFARFNRPAGLLFHQVCPDGIAIHMIKVEIRKY
jgi:hypothetical protein